MIILYIEDLKKSLSGVFLAYKEVLIEKRAIDEKDCGNDRSAVLCDEQPCVRC